MKILIDADGCPVVDLTVQSGKRHGLKVLILCDTSHRFERDDAETITVSKGTDSVDYALVNLIKPGDIVVTQDYGLAAMCLARKGFPIRQDGMEYHEGNIDALLMSRHLAKKIRNAGGRLKGNAKRNAQEDDAFVQGLERLIARVYIQEGQG